MAMSVQASHVRWDLYKWLVGVRCTWFEVWGRRSSGRFASVEMARSSGREKLSHEQSLPYVGRNVGELIHPHPKAFTMGLGEGSKFIIS